MLGMSPCHPSISHSMVVISDESKSDDRRWRHPLGVGLSAGNENRPLPVAASAGADGVGVKWTGKRVRSEKGPSCTCLVPSMYSKCSMETHFARPWRACQSLPMINLAYLRHERV